MKRTKSWGRFGSRCAIALMIASALFKADLTMANPYLAKPGEPPVTVRVATCAVSGGFMHLYTASP